MSSTLDWEEVRRHYIRALAEQQEVSFREWLSVFPPPSPAPLYRECEAVLL